MGQLELFEPRSLVGAAQLRLGAIRQPGEVRGMQIMALDARRWQVPPVLPDDLEQNVTRRVALNDARRDQGVERIAARSLTADGRRGLRRECVPEERHAAEQMLRRGVEQTEAPVDRGAHRSMTLGRIPGTCGQRVETGVEKLEQLRRGPRSEPRGSELDREWDPVEPVTDLGEQSGACVDLDARGGHPARE